MDLDEESSKDKLLVLEEFERRKRVFSLAKSLINIHDSFQVSHLMMFCRLDKSMFQRMMQK